MSLTITWIHGTHIGNGCKLLHKSNCASTPHAQATLAKLLRSHRCSGDRYFPAQVNNTCNYMGSSIILRYVRLGNTCRHNCKTCSVVIKDRQNRGTVSDTDLELGSGCQPDYGNGGSTSPRGVTFVSIIWCSLT